MKKRKNNNILNAKTWLIICCLALVTFGVYYNSLQVPFMLDDHSKIIKNPDIRSLSNITTKLIYPYSEEWTFARNDPSRPLTYLSLAINYHFNQLNPYGYHVGNVLIHILNVILFFFLLKLLLKLLDYPNEIIAFLVALLFAVHPINVNVVTYVIARSGSLSTLFYMLTVFLFLQFRNGKKLLFYLSLLSFVLSLSASQIAITIPAVLLVMDILLLRDIKKRKFSHMQYWLVIIIYLISRYIYFGNVGDVEASVINVTRGSYFLTQMVVILKYLQLLIFPFGFSFEHGYSSVESIGDFRLLFSLVIYAVFACVILITCKKEWKYKNLFILGAAWFVMTISPTSSLFPTTATMAENRMYLPSLGLYISLLALLITLFEKINIKNRIYIPVIVYAFILGGITNMRNIMYQNPILMWKSVVNKYDNHHRGHQNLGNAYKRSGETKLAIQEYEKSLEFMPEKMEVLNNLAASYMDLKEYKKAASIFRLLLDKNPDSYAVHANLGVLYDSLGKKDLAVQEYKEGLRLNPNALEPHYNLGTTYYEMGQYSESLRWINKALEISPQHPVILKTKKSLENILNKNRK